MSFSVHVAISFSGNTLDLSPAFTDVSSDVMSVAVRRGRQHELNRIEAGTAKIVLLNTSGNYWPDNSGGSYYGNIEPLKRVKVWIEYNSTNYYIFTGIIESWQPDFMAKPATGPLMVINCVDIQKCLSNFIFSYNFPYDELSGVRIAEVVNGFFGWPAGLCDFDSGISYITAQDVIEANAMAYLYRVQDTEQGILFQAGDGTFVFHDRHHRMVTTESNTSQATFGADIPPGGTDLEWTSIYVSLDSHFIYNFVHITRQDGEPQIAQDSVSIAKYGTRSLAKDNLLNINDADCLDQASYLKSRYSSPHPRVRSITRQAGINPSGLLPKMMGFEIGHRITVRLQPAEYCRTTS
jgi:hypothetical protein